jgi:predicted transposase YbfD/YdcC
LTENEQRSACKEQKLNVLPFTYPIITIDYLLCQHAIWQTLNEQKSVFNGLWQKRN